jgi:hypothetical protein
MPGEGNVVPQARVNGHGDTLAGRQGEGGGLGLTYFGLKLKG